MATALSFAKRKCTPSTNASVVTAMASPLCARSRAASSPMPSTTSLSLVGRVK
jgi:hypothetical protein